jgi:protoheme IX farnesyltransferase
MATGPTIAAFEVAAVKRHSLAHPGALADYWALTKPEVNLLIAVTTFAGFCSALPTRSHPFPFVKLIHTLLGTLLVAAGTGTLNQYIERDYDAQMPRTARRPLAAGRLTPSATLWFGTVLSCAGALYLAVAVDLLASLLAVLTLVSYLFLYTPLKRKTPMCMLIGAFPGAMPPLIGWAAASGRLSLEAGVLYAVLFLWQFPHFMAIAWMYREDYARAGYLVLPFGEQRGPFMAWQSVAPALALIPLSLAPSLLGHAGPIYFMGALLLSSSFLYYGAKLALHRSNAAARRLLFVSIIHLPLLFILMMLDKI